MRRRQNRTVERAEVAERPRRDGGADSEQKERDGGGRAAGVGDVGDNFAGYNGVDERLSGEEEENETGEREKRRAAEGRKAEQGAERGEGEGRASA